MTWRHVFKALAIMALFGGFMWGAATGWLPVDDIETAPANCPAQDC